MIKVRLGDIAKTTSGATPLSSIKEYYEDANIPWINSGEVGQYKINKAQKFISEKGFINSNTKFIPKGSVLIAMYGATAGRTSLLNIDNATTNQAICSILPNENISNFFLKYKFDTLYKYLVGISSGSARDNLSQKTIQDLILDLPDLPTQQKIASVLSALDDKIELNNRINAELEAMAKTLYDYWFVQFDFPIVTSSGVEKPYKTSGGKMVYNETLKREIPEGWEVKTIGDYCKSTGGFAFKSSWWTDNGMPVVKIKDIQEDYTINLSDLAFVDISDKNIDDKFKAKPGDVLIAMTGATVGKYAIVPYTEKPLYVNQRVGYFNLGIKPEKKLPFFINSLNQKYFRESVFTLASGAAQPNISNEQINNIQLLLPSKEIIELYNKVFEPYYSKILLNQKQNQELSALRDWLLPMLMNGQVKVG